jgi:putative inorganic carbon (hco3(-)) transporter
MILFYFLIVSLPLTNHWLFGYGWGDFTIVKILALVCFPFAIIRLVSRVRSSGFSVSGVSISLLIYLSIALFSYFLVQGRGLGMTLEARKSGGPGATPPDINIFSMLLFFLLVVGLIDSAVRLRRVLLVMIASVGVASVYTIRDWWFNRSFYADYRPGYISGDANYFGLCAASALVLALHLALVARRGWEKIFLFGCVGLISVAFFMASSRGGILGLAVGLLFLMVRSGRGLRGLAMVATLMLPLFVIVPSTLIQRFSHPSVGDEEAVEARKITWMAGLRMVASHPIVGVGLGQFESVVVSYESGNDSEQYLTYYWSVAHNTYIEVAAELGIPGLLAYLAMVFTSFRAWVRFGKKENEPPTPLLREASVGFQAALVTAAICLFFISAWWFRFHWLLLFLGASLPAVEQNEGRKASVRTLETDLVAVHSLRL